MCRVGLIGENSIEYVDKLIDIWNSGNCAILIDFQIPIKTAVQMMIEANITQCFIEQKLFDKVNKITNNEIQFVPYVVSCVSPQILSNKIRTKYCLNYSHDEAVVIYSSGTTGHSKGIILSHYAITTNADAIIEYMELTKDDCIYTVRPFSHSSTLTGELLVALRSNSNLLISPTIVPPRYIFENVQKYQISLLCVNPALLSLLCKERCRSNTDLSSLRTIYSSGSILDDEIVYKSKERFSGVEIFNVYGLTEAGPRVSAQRVDCCKSNSVGKPLIGVEVVVVDENGNVLLNGECGVIHVNTPSRYSGYITGEEKHKSLYKDWLNTGDMGSFDGFGELHIVDRIDDVIFLGAHKIYPKDVASKIVKQADIDTCVVTAIRINSENILCCLYTASSDIRNDIKKKLGTVLTKYEIPKVFIRTEVIPKTRTGKISSQLVKEVIIKNLERRKTYDS